VEESSNLIGHRCHMLDLGCAVVTAHAMVYQLWK